MRDQPEAIENDSVEDAIEFCKTYLERKVTLPKASGPRCLIFGYTFAQNEYACRFDFSEQGTLCLVVEFGRALAGVAAHRFYEAAQQVESLGVIYEERGKLYWEPCTDGPEFTGIHSQDDLDDLFERAEADLPRFEILYLAAQEQGWSIADMLGLVEMTIPIIGHA